ncbi:monoamine oxidase [Silvibacterium bohemicum]|uniref:Tryptophan 2-monooxygenase n=1 Tax=Silvibacterium bohemicum TaxID=1577686 RepID=A0A841K190_9BACT|nr:FAD-dependent oxidoreductase [Silvibacterium bohemicum]MBB6147160.1 monoamine oxidase [Silvibacterium bohemicum]
MNRRAFLAAFAATALAPAAHAAFAPLASPRRKVIIVGGGLAGLSCAYELQKYGLDAVVLEGQGRAGGRVQTLREGLYPGLTAETGATRIPDTHDFTLSYVREFGLPLEPFHGGDYSDVLHLRGKNYLAGQTPEPDWPLQLTPEERRLGRKGMAERYLAGPVQLAKGTEKSPEIPKAILAQDGPTLSQYLSKQGLSPDAIKLLTLGGDTEISTGLLLLVESNEQINHQYFHIAGGNDQLPAALAKQVGGAVRYGCRVVSIGQDDSGAWAVIENAEGHETIRGDYVVSALPFSVARNLFADARLPADKQRVIQELNYFPVDKIFLQMRKQFWKANGQSGFANTDLLSDRFWALGPDSLDQRGLLLSYVIGSHAVKLDEMDVESRIKQTLADAETVFPGANEHFEAARVKSWAQDPWQLGGLSGFAPGKLDTIYVNARREGRIFFAGEHTSRWNGWMQGAIESGQRVAKEIHG